MAPNKQCFDFIKMWEGLNLNAYQDSAGIWTIGYGSILYQNNIPVKQGDLISLQQAEVLLEWEVSQKAISAVHAITATISQNQFDSLVSFSYNAGIAALQSSTLLKRVNSNAADPTIRDAFMMWDKAHVDGNLVVVQGLFNRRKAEADLYFTP